MQEEEIQATTGGICKKNIYFEDRVGEEMQKKEEEEEREKETP